LGPRGGFETAYGTVGMVRFDKFLNGVEKVFAFFAGLLLIFVALSTCAAITLRFMKIAVPLWSVQFNEYSLLWMTFLGGAWLLRRGRHVSLDIVSRRLKPRGLNMLNTILGFMGLGVCGLLTWISGTVAWDNFQRNVMDVRAVDVPKYIILSIMCAGFLLLFLEFLNDVYRNIRQLKAGE
jgi:TRAP-type C4-dicarboxylate transport system permease small subunit